MTKIAVQRAAMMVAMGLSLFGLPALAQNQQGPRLPGCNDPRAIARYLRLSQEQATAWRALREELRDASKPYVETIEPLREELGALLDGEDPDACTVGGLVVQIDTQHDAIADLREAYVEDFEALLTAEQLAKWEALQAVCQANNQTPGAG
jgi:Spy/CpxP family protein refolding chaperone